MPVRFNVMLGRMFGMFSRMDLVTVGQMRMVCGRFVIPIQVMLGGFVVMACSVLVMLRCLGVMTGCFV